jgi:hypothetical protein
MTRPHSPCSCCIEVGDDLNLQKATPGQERRAFLKTVGSVALAAGLGVARAPWHRADAAKNPNESAENFVQHLYESLNPEQKKALCFPFDHPLRREVGNNWHIVPQRIGEFLNSDQQELVRQILRGITTEDGYERFEKQMKDDTNVGLGDYSCALFGQPGERLQWVLAGRHSTLRADGNSTSNAAFGGPIFYGHAVAFEERPDHAGNVWWHQARAANKVFEALDGKQREKALLETAPPDSEKTVRLRGNVEAIPGLAGADMSADQLALLEATMQSLLDMFRAEDVKEVMECLKKNDGLKAAHVSFYKEEDIGNDGIWDIWRVEGPAFVWYFRGSPHVHTWVNIAHRGPTLL